MTEHTALPWSVDPYSSVVDSKGKTIFANGFSSALTHGPSMDLGKANAAFIVKAANSHEALVQALTEARAAVVYAYDGTDAGSSDETQFAATLAKIDAALDALPHSSIKDR